MLLLALHTGLMSGKTARLRLRILLPQSNKELHYTANSPQARFLTSALTVSFFLSCGLNEQCWGNLNILKVETLSDSRLVVEWETRR
jgi:hypothetical protein